MKIYPDDNEDDLDLIRSRKIEQEVLDMLDEPTAPQNLADAPIAGS